MFDATGRERVRVKVKSMEDIPVGANPFHHDAFSMGTHLVRGWVAMHPGFDRDEDPESLDWIYLYNSRSGQRIRIELQHQVPWYRLKKLRYWIMGHYNQLLHRYA